MEEENPWLDHTSVTHSNKKSERPELRKKEKEEKKREEEERKREDERKKREEIRKVDSDKGKEEDKKEEEEVNNNGKTETKEEEITRRELEKLVKGASIVPISSIKKDKDERKVSFLKALLDEFDVNLPEKSKNFAIKVFGEEWLSCFIKDIQDLKSDILNSKFYASQKDLIFLKYIFLLQQGV